MTAWHPPIPAGKLYSKEALELGAGLALLVWCYDGIQRDGHIDIELNKLPAEFGVSYRTIKEWWAALRDGPFFRKKEDRGRKGWRVWLADEWIDWHVMANNYPVAEGQKSALKEKAQGQDSVPEVAQVPLKSRSSPAEGQKSALQQSAYKVDHTIQSPNGERGAKTRAPPADDIAYSHLAVITYHNYFKRWPSLPDAKKIAATATDFEQWSSVCDLWKQNRWDFLKVDNLISRYQKGNEANGTHQSNRPRPAHPNAPSRSGYPIVRPVYPDDDDTS